MVESKVFVIDDDADVRAGLELLFFTRGYRVQAYASAEAYLASGVADQPGCLVLDIKLSGMSGLELQAELLRRNHAVQIVFLSAYGDIPMTVKAIQSGAVDFLTKPVNGAVLVERVRLAIERDKQKRAELEALIGFRKKAEGLTLREREVLQLALTGMPNKDIATQLAVSYRTVEAHRSRILLKLGGRSMLEVSQITRGLFGRD